MAKKIGIIVAVLAVLGIIIFVVTKEDTTNNVRNTNTTNTVINSSIEDYKIEHFEEQLKENGVRLSNKQKITSEQLNEEGYSYELNGETIEIYHVEQEKIDHLKVSTKPGFEIIIKTRDNMSMYAIYYNEILVLNSMKNSSAILNALEK